MQNLDEIKAKVKKLMDHAESANKIGNLQEAELFASKISDLLLKYNLSKKEIIEHHEELEVDGVDPKLEVKKAQGDWMAQLLNVLCDFNFCKAIFTSRKIDKEYKITLIGAYENVEVVSYLYDVLKNQFQRLAKKGFSERVKSWQNINTFEKFTLIEAGVALEDIKSSPDGRFTIKRPWKYSKTCPNRSKFLKSFYLGANVGIKRKLEEDNAKVQFTDIANQINALMVINDNAIDKYVALNFPNLKTAPSRRKKVDTAAYNQGLEAGKNSSMAKGLYNGDTVATKMLK